MFGPADLARPKLRALRAAWVLLFAGRVMGDSLPKIDEPGWSRDPAPQAGWFMPVRSTGIKEPVCVSLCGSVANQGLFSCESVARGRKNRISRRRTQTDADNIFRCQTPNTKHQTLTIVFLPGRPARVKAALT